VTPERRRRVLLVMLAATRFRYPAGRDPEAIRLLRGWLDGWLGVGRIVTGMGRHGYDLQLTRYDREGWRATFYPEGRSHSVTAAVGSAWEPTPWRAVQHAALEALLRLERPA
jgi:hypothetical protein